MSFLEFVISSLNGPHYHPLVSSRPFLIDRSSLLLVLANLARYLSAFYALYQRLHELDLRPKSPSNLRGVNGVPLGKLDFAAASSHSSLQYIKGLSNCPSQLLPQFDFQQRHPQASSCPPQVNDGASVIRSGFQAIRSASTSSPTEIHANRFMISGPVRPFTPVNSPETKVPVPIHPSTMAPGSSRAQEHVDPHLGINFYPIQGRWSPVLTSSAGNFPPGLRSPDFVNPSSTDGSSAADSESSSSSIHDGFSSGTESNSSAPNSGPPSIPHSSDFPSPSSSDMRSVPPSEVFYATRPRPQPVATGSGNSYDDPMVVDDDSASGSNPDSVPFGPTTEWGNTQPAAPQINTANPDPSAREMMAFDYRAIRDQLVGSNPLPFGTQVYREEDLLFLFQHIANNFIHLSNKYPASTLGEIEDRVQFYQNLQWVFTADRQVFLATHCGYP
ncbi:hypothetical protein PGT21_036286 [Puccinia graminis f. sp. tritici]|uniref:Uncharacterized protein n=1 Tax=Puccinia graminis f. sp. tritici TaxID=56615 RepID=A0A5B0NES2_PUCGR|nr:hypothetical protein PGT21_036286 [Puccinia graminis f. sp. tritici]